MEEKELFKDDFRAILSFNTQLVKEEQLSEVFNKISLFLKDKINIDKIAIEIEDCEVFKNFDTQSDESKKSVSVILNDKDSLKLSFFYVENEELEKIDKYVDFTKMLLNVISQTIYNKYLAFKLMELTVKDSITGLYNRQFVDEYLKNLLPLSKREQKKIAFLKVGIDHFKAVIDEFDYTIGDKVLKELAKSLSHTVRVSDIVARIDADEFLVILNNVSNEDDAIMVASKIIDNFKEAKITVDKKSNQTLKKTVCTGISIYPDDAKEIDEILKSSDIALYEAKNKGRGKYFKYKKEDISDIDIF